MNDMEIPENITIGNKYDPAMKITDQAEADKYFEFCVQHAMITEPNRELAIAKERKNLAYYAGYYDDETRERVERLFHCEHPFFGSIAEKGPPSPAEAFRMGLELGKQR
jgi:hypothetical protein